MPPIRLECDAPHGSFDLKDVYFHGKARTIATMHARDLLAFHALANLYADGLIDSGTRVAVYPKSTPGAKSDLFVKFWEVAAKFFHGWLKDEVLVRSAKAPDTSKLRGEKRHGEVTFLVQANSVNVSPGIENHVRDRNVIVFDDFSTTGMSLDWARNLLVAAGAKRVVLVAMGKFGRTNTAHHCHIPGKANVVPYCRTTYQDGGFQVRPYAMKENVDGMKVTQEMFRLWKEKKPYES